MSADAIEPLVVVASHAFHRPLVDVEDDEARIGVGLEGRGSDAAALDLCPKPTLDSERLLMWEPTPSSSASAKIAADAIITPIAVGRPVVDVEYDQIRASISVYIGHCDPCCLGLVTKPSGYLDWQV